MTIKKIAFTGLVASLLLVAGITQAAVVYENGGVTLNQALAEFTADVDASGYESLVFSFDYDTRGLDGNADDHVVYGWSVGEEEHDLGTIVGLVGETEEEVGSVNASLPAEAQVAGLTLYIRVAADSPTSDDAVISNVALSGDEVSADVAMVGEVGYESLQAAVNAACAAETVETIEMVADVTTSAQVTIDCSLTLEGNGHTLFAPFAKTDNSNNSAIGIIGAEGSVIIDDLTIDGTGSTGYRHGINTYLSSDIVLNDVSIINNNASAITVNGSTLTANNLSTSDNAWGAVNVDPGDGVTLPSVFTLNSSDLSENNQIWSDGDHVGEAAVTATVTVNAEGYDLYTLNDTSKQYWLNKAPSNVAYIDSVLYATAQGAINAALEGQTVNVGSGTYPDSLLVEKSITLQGTGSSKPVISGDAGTAYIVKVNGVAGPVTLDNLEVNGGSTNSFDYGILVSGSGSVEGPVEVSNSVVKNVWNASANGIDIEASSYASVHDNIVSSFHKRGIRFTNSSGEVYDNEVIGDNVDGNTRVQNLVNLWGGSDVEIYSNELHNALTDEESVPQWDSPAIFISSYGGTGASHADVHDNEIYSSDTGIVITSVYAETDTSSAVVENNYFHDLNWAINFEAGTGSATLEGNRFEDVGMAVNAEVTAGPLENPPVVVAERNWWGSALAGDIQGLVISTVDFDPWYMDADMTVLSSEATAPDETGTAVLSESATQVVVNSSDTDVTVEAGSVENASINLGGLITDGEGDVPQITVNSNLVDVFIPETTITSSDDNWDGVLKLPTLVAAPTIVADADYAAVAVLAIEVGADSELMFDDAVKLTFPGEAGHMAGWSRGGVFTKIDETCDSSEDPDLSAGEDCKIDVGGDLVIWTRHFTTFVTYTQVSIDTGSDSTGGSSGGSGGTVAGAATVQVGPVVGEVLGAMTEAERQAQIQAIRTQLISLISQLIALLQAQVNAAQ